MIEEKNHSGMIKNGGMASSGTCTSGKVKTMSSKMTPVDQMECWKLDACVDLGLC